MSVKNEVKIQAAVLAKRLKSLGVDIKNTQAIEAVSSMLNSSDWNRLNAKLNNSSSRISFERREHKILTAAPGTGKTTALINIFRREIENSQKIPIYITFHSASKITDYLNADICIAGKFQVVNIKLDTSDYSLKSSDINFEAGGIIVVLQTDERHSAFCNILLMQFLRKFHSLFEKRSGLKIGTLMIDDMHLANSYEQISTKEIESKRTPKNETFLAEDNQFVRDQVLTPSVPGIFAQLSYILDLYRPHDSIEQIIVATQSPISSIELSCFNHPIKTLIYGYMFHRGEMKDCHAVEHIREKSFGLFEGKDRYIEDILWYSCVIKNNLKFHVEWRSVQNEKYRSSSAGDLSEPPVVSWLLAKAKLKDSLG